MQPVSNEPGVLQTTAGEFPLHEYHLRCEGREWKIQHTGMILTHEDERRYLRETANPLPYGVALWPASIALAHEIASRGDELKGGSVLELGAGTGLPGIVAASLGARVLQTDRHELALSVCRRNSEGNGVSGVEHRLADWTDWHEEDHYQWILGSDVLYADTLHPHLRHIFNRNLAPEGRVLLADPFRTTSWPLLEALEADGWEIRVSRWKLGDEAGSRVVGVFELSHGESGPG